MPRDANGNHSRPLAYQAGTKARANDVNTNEADLSAEISDSLSRSGKGKMLRPIGIDEGGTGEVVEVYLRHDKAQALTDAKILQARSNLGDKRCDCYFGQINATTARLAPRNGNSMFIGGQQRPIPDAGIDLSVASLAAETTYYVFAYWDAAANSNAGAIRLEAVSTTYAITGGIPVKVGDASRTLVGMARTAAAGQMSNDGSRISVLSYWNRRIKAAQFFVGSTPAGSGTAFQEYAAARAGGLCWADERVAFSFNVPIDLADNGSASATTYVYGCVDGVTNTIYGNSTLYSSQVGNFWTQAVGNVVLGLSEGYHTFSFAVSASAAGAPWQVIAGAQNTVWTMG